MKYKREYKRKSKAVALKKNNEATVLGRDTEPANFISAFLDGVTSIGLLYPAMITPIRYTEGYGTDMEMVGRDMWFAEEKFRHGTQKDSEPASTK